MNLPTGKSTVATDQQRAAGLIGSDFLAFPISNMGTGFGGTGGVAMARPLGDDWNFGLRRERASLGAVRSVRRRRRQALHYQPGNEYRAASASTTRSARDASRVGLTYSTFGNDNLGGLDLQHRQSLSRAAGLQQFARPGRISLTGWNLFRTRGTLADGSLLDHEEHRERDARVRHSGRRASCSSRTSKAARGIRPGPSTSYLGTFGLRMQFNMGGVAVVPSGGFTIGQIAAAQAATSVGNRRRR